MCRTEFRGVVDICLGSHINYQDTNKHKANTKLLSSEILETANHFFQEKGFEKTTLPDICRKLNINNTQFFKHFDSLDEVLETLWAR